MNSLPEQLLELVAKLLHVAPTEISLEDQLSDQGLNSIQLVQVSEWLTDRGFDIDFSDLVGDTSLQAWLDLIDLEQSS